MSVHKSGFVNIIGNPNVGKSTLMNAFVGEKLSIITSKSQTTRHRILGILNGEDFQVVFSDTPGIIKPAYLLQDSMMNFVRSAFEDADMLLYVVEVGEKKLKDETFFERLKSSKVPIILILNKIDVSNQDVVESEFRYWEEALPNAEIYPTSGLTKFNVDNVLSRVLELLPESPAYYPKDAITDKPERFFVNESVREKILMYYDKEIPYAVEVDTEEFIENDEIIRIRTVIMVERESQRAIIIGHKGQGLKKIGTAARRELERFFDKKIYLKFHIKVNKNWRTDAEQLKRFGYPSKADED